MSVDLGLIYERIAAAVNDAQVPGNTLQVIALDHMPSAPEVPLFYPVNFVATYDKTYGGGVDITTTWHLVLARSDDKASWNEATRLVGSGENTIRAALIAARGASGEDALGGAAEDIHLISSSGPTDIDLGGGTHLLVIEFALFVEGN